MAKWGEGDPRWLVESRDDGKNVNGWHWEEINKLEWSKKRLAELFCDMEGTIDPSLGCIRISKVKEISGEVAITIRKGNKKFPVFDLKITLSWEANEPGDVTLIKGDIKVEEFTSACEEDEWVITTSAEGTGNLQTKFSALALTMKAQIAKQLKTYLEELHAF